MQRREFLAASAAGLASAACNSAAAPEAPRRPNVLVIYTDEHSAWTLGVYGGKLIGTPHLDRIGREGAVFHNYFVNSAVCTPSRGCFVTGRYPHAHGAYTNDVELDRSQVTIAECFRRAGYETGFAGKWHLDGEPRPGWVDPSRSMGFEDCRWMYNRGHWKRIVEKPEGWPENHSVAKVGNQEIISDKSDGRPDLSYHIDDEGEYFTDWITDRCIEFLGRERDAPFFYYLSIPDPHTPFSVRAPYDTMYRPEDMPIPETLYEKDLPAWAERSRQAMVERENVDSWQDPEREAILRRILSQYCGMVKCIDDNVGRILAALEANGQLDNTLILFTSDHGNYLGEHGLYFKNQIYETAYRVSFLMRLPGAIPAGTEVKECVSSVDVQSSVLELCGVEPSGAEQGSSFAKLARGETDPDWPNEAYLHHSSFARAGVFTPEWELALVKDGESVLFDRVNDPLQTRNLFGDPALQETVRDLVARIVEHNYRVGAPAYAWLEEIV